MIRNVLVTGAAGFLGSHLCMRYLEDGWRVFGLDDFSSSDPDSAHLKALKAQHPGRFYMTEADVATGWQAWQGVMPLRPRFDLILNFACPASPPAYQSMPIHTMRTCTVGTMNVLDLAFRDEAVVVHASTSEVYGDPDVSPQPETYRGRVNPYGPRACYDEGKRAAEAICYDHIHSCDVDVRLVRIFNTYGPHMDPHDGRVVSNFIRQALCGEQLTVYGRGRQGRSFCYVDDLVEGIVRVAALEKNPQGPINLGNPHEFTVWELAHMVLDKAGIVGPDAHERAIAFADMPIDDPTQRRPDVSRAKGLLGGWEPKVQLSEGLDRTIAYFRDVLSKR